MDGHSEKFSIAGQSFRHDSALAHCTGDAKFVDDIPDIPGTLHAALALSEVAHGRVKSLNTEQARAMPGVVSVLTAADIIGHNDISATHRGVPMTAAEPAPEICSMASSGDL